MPNLNISVSDDVYTELKEVAEQLNQSPEQCALLALNHFLQTDTIENAIEGVARMQDKEELIGFPELKEELGLDVKFHPLAMDELEELEEEDQIEILESLINRISGEGEEEEGTLDLVIKEQTEGNVVISIFPFGDITYQTGPTIVIYHIALAQAEEEEEFEDEEE